MNVSRIATVAAGLLLAGQAWGQITPIGPFAGAFDEGFETQSTQQAGACVRERIFGGRADLCAPPGSVITISTGLVGATQPLSGAQMLHTDLVIEIAFDQPARRFGGWFATPWVQGAGNAFLYDAAGQLIGAVPFQLVPCAPTCAWVWNGWEVSGPGVARIVLDSPTGTGGHFELDDLELDPACDGTPTVYCTPKVNSLGCTPALAVSGSPSATASAGFVVSAANVRNQHVGLLIYGVDGRAALPFHGGWLCVAPMVRRSVPVQSGGSALPLQDCTGVYALDMNAFAAGLLGGVPLPALRQPGTVVDCQFWGRDSGFPPPLNIALSAGLEYTVCP